MKKRLTYMIPTLSVETVTDADILTLSGPDLDPNADPVVIQPTGWKD